MSSTSVLSANLPPLAERIRPRVLGDFIGQEKILHEKGLLCQAISANQPFSIIFWGPPGTGKTTLARILSREFGADYLELSAISSGVKNIREVLEKGKAAFQIGKRSILFIDEIHRFSKSQQDALLHSVEDGSISLLRSVVDQSCYDRSIGRNFNLRFNDRSSIYNSHEYDKYLFVSSLVEKSEERK